MSELRERFESLSRTRSPDLWRDIERREPRRSVEPSPARRVLVGVVALVVAIAGIGFAVVTFGNSEPPGKQDMSGAPVANGAIAYISNGELWIVQPDGSNATKVDPDVPGAVGSVSWSPDGQRFAFDVNSYPAEGAPEGGYDDVYAANADGSGVVRLTHDRGARLPVWSPDGSRIAYTEQDGEGGSQIYTMNADGSDPVQLTRGPAFSVRPAWSPDGSRIVFESVVDANSDVYVMDADGRATQRLTSDPAWQGNPVWSPQGDIIAFVSDRAPSGIYLMDADGSDVRPLEPDADVANLNLTWSPDGRFLAFASSRGPDFARAVYVLDPSTGATTQITDRGPLWGPAWQPLPIIEASIEPTTSTNGLIYYRVGEGEGTWSSVMPDGSDPRGVFQGETVPIAQIAWSPDGTRIAYQNPIADQRGIFVANGDGSDAVRLTEGANDAWPSWSPDGAKILYSSSAYDPDIGPCPPAVDFQCPTDVYVMDADGSNATRLTTDPAPEYQPAWSPDAKRIAFVKVARDVGFTAVFTMDPDGSDARQVSTAGGGSDFAPSWSPDGSQLAFSAIRKEDWGVWVVGAAGDGERQLLQTGWSGDLAWSPSGDLVAFTGNVDGNEGLFVMRPEGGGVTRIAVEPGIGVAGDIAWQPIPAPATTVEPSPTPPFSSAEVVDTFPVDQDVRSVVYGEESVWVAVSNGDGGLGGRIVRIDPETHQVQAEIPVDAIPTWEVGGGAMVVEDGSLWVTGSLEAPGAFDDPGGGADAAVIRIDTTTNEVVQTFELGGTHGADLTFLDGELWVLLFGDETVGNDMEVVRVDPGTGAVLARIPLRTGWAHTIAAAEGRLVVLESGPGAANAAGFAAVIDPATNAISRVAIPSDYLTPMPVVSGGQVWISLDPGFARLDPVTLGFPEPTITLPAKFSDCCGFVEADDRGVWFLSLDQQTGTDRQLKLFDPPTSDVTQLIVLDEGTPVAMAIAPNAVWILNYEGTLTHVELG